METGFIVITFLVGLLVGTFIALGVTIFRKNKNRNDTTTHIRHIMDGKPEKSRLKRTVEAISKGNIGDAIKETTEALGIEQCEGCAKRQVALNFGDQRKAKETEIDTADYLLLKEFFSEPPNNNESNSYRFASKNQYLALTTVHNKYFKKSEKPSNCNPCRIRMIKKLQLLFESRE